MLILVGDTHEAGIKIKNLAHILLALSKNMDKCAYIRVQP